MSNFKNIESLIIPQDFDELATVTELQSIPLKKPGKQQFIRVKPVFCYRFGVIEVEGANPSERDLFIVIPELVPQITQLPGFSQRVFRLYVTRPNNSPGVWPMKMPRGTGARSDQWSVTAKQVAKKEESDWVRVQSDMSLQSYTAIKAQAEFPDPTWPTLPDDEIIKLAVGEKHLIDTLDHPVIDQLLGRS